MKRLFFLGSSSLLIAGTALSAAAGCNAIVGAGDYHVVTDATSAGDAGDIDVNVQPDTAPPPVDAHPEADAVPEASAVCGQGLPVNDARFKSVLNACVLSAGCDWSTVSWTISHCITDSLLHAVPGLAGLSNVATCNDVITFTGRGFTTTAGGECTTATPGYHCLGAKQVYCNADKTGVYQDCTKLGSNQCSSYTTPDPEGGTVTVSDCVVATCAGAPEGTVGCSAAGALYTCHSGTGYGESCPAINAACSAADKTCYYKGDTCATQGESCNGATREACLGGTGVPNTLYRFDCSAAGLSCAQDGVATVCVAPGCTTATAKACKESCKDGKTATFCVGGAKLDVDCTTFSGFTSCGMFGTAKDKAQCY